MGSEGSVRDTAITQVSFGGFDRYVTAKDFTNYLEDKIGSVWRCRLKTSWTPPNSYPSFKDTNTSDISKTNEYDQVEPHAFVHFGSPESTRYAVEADGCCDLFFRGKPLKVSLGPQTPFHINQRRRTTTPYKLSGAGVEIGLLVSQDEFFVGWRGPPNAVDFLIDPFDGTCKFLFTRDTAFSFKDTKNHAVIKCNYKVEFFVREINEFRQYKDSSSLVLFLQLASSPLVFYRTAADDIEETVPFEMLDDDDPWIRTTDFTPSGAIGRCNCYRVLIPPRHGMKLMRGMDYFRGCRILSNSPGQPLRIRDEPDFGILKQDFFFCIEHERGIDFDILFLLNAVLHKGIINQYQLSDNFYDLLRCNPNDVNVSSLRHLCSYKRPVFDAYEKLKVVQEWLLKNPKLFKNPRQLGDIIHVRRLVITPTKAYCLPPEVELSNRVLRHYREVADRFLRVTFMDESMQTININALNYYVAPIVRKNTSSPFQQKTKVFERVRNILTDGFQLCGRTYSFLAFSSNQLRDRSAWFFAENGNVSVAGIMIWMGKFRDRNVAKCAARIGQCFSSTYATVEIPQSQVNQQLPDIERNGYTFSDGIGIITQDLASEVANRLNLKENPPCAYQIRYAGYKGVVACWPAKDDTFRMFLRPSMNKFASNHSILEVCSWARFQPGFLNRQIVTLLSALMVPDEIFWNMQNHMISKLEKIIENRDVAFDILTGSCAEQGHTAAIMLSAGFKPQTEPHLRGMLSSIRAAQFSDLREKARIFVPFGRWLMGCLDELGVLKQGQCFIQVSNTAIENCFFKHGSRFSEKNEKREIVRGLVVIAKNPCLHPGDVRILEAVDSPGLHHLHDCLVFPQEGDRPHTDEASGSDLDGDLYFVTWDENLVPPSKRSWIPMEYRPAKVQELSYPVTQRDIKDFFSKNIVNENLGAICNAHVVHADLSDDGALDEKCITLAELAAQAVDFPKTGKIVTMPANLKPKQYPDYMGKEEFQTYRSQKILGRLFRHVKEICIGDVAESTEAAVVPEKICYDPHLEITGSADFIIDAWNHKCSYDAQLNGLLGQYKVNREEEIVTGHIWSMPKYKSRKQGDLKERLKHSYSSLRKEFRQIFEKLDMDVGLLCDYERNKMLEQKASAWYQVTYNPIWVEKTLKLQGPDDEGGHVMLSFPWIASDYLARIKIKLRAMDIKKSGSSKPIDSLACYIFDRIRDEQ